MNLWDLRWFKDDWMGIHLDLSGFNEVRYEDIKNDLWWFNRQNGGLMGIQWGYNRDNGDTYLVSSGYFTLCYGSHGPFIDDKHDDLLYGIKWNSSDRMGCLQYTLKNGGLMGVWWEYHGILVGYTWRYCK